MQVMIAPKRGEAEYQAALATDQQWYTLPRLMGRSGALWLWGEWVTEQIARPGRDPRDSYATLGTLPVTGKAVHSPLAADPRVLDVAAAFSALAAGRGEQPLPHPWHRQPWTPSQMIIWLYYGLGYGHPLPADSRNKDSYAEARRRWGVNGRVGDGAVAELLRFLPELQRSDSTEMWVYGRRRRAVQRMSRYLSTQREQR